MGLWVGRLRFWAWEVVFGHEGLNLGVGWGFEALGAQIWGLGELVLGLSVVSFGMWWWGVR